MSANAGMVSRWTDVAPSWEKHRELIRRKFYPVTEALVKETVIEPGQTVLDLAMGPGEPALDIAALVGPRGRVVGIDVSPEMVAAARRAAETKRLRNTQFEVGSPEHLTLPDNTFDAVVSRFGAMFFPSPVDALREILRVLKPGKKFALAVWHVADANPYFNSTSHILAQYIPKREPGPDAIDAFRFATPGNLLSLLQEAGAANPSEHLLKFDILAALSVEAFWEMRCEISDSLRDAFAVLTEEQIMDVKRQSLEAFRPYFVEGEMRFPAEVLIVSGVKGA